MAHALKPIEKRYFQRIPADIKGSVTGDGAFVACSIDNLTDCGAKVRLLVEPGYLQITEGSEIHLNIPNFDQLCGQVVWIDESDLGILFNESHPVTAYLQ
ncbi:MAG: PilZ domain-containing protein [Rhodospirillales bacterium]|jgi:hypothetical protein|nr:PilZ domain-containing protein [Rhodospirillales bacterium]MBT4040728.1 PilZ domain-containing protein [Rhodospirillales bacterium]MBT4628074.1 PilZ domain-containing protein [Rhodospirillales bacterium]MBT5353399.1 PilZ domain-containing protein [Rhodospirillales bacterium]MBT5521110.1 PilZ domain-containing protein [Rhodospirillales bacterium]